MRVLAACVLLVLLWESQAFPRVIGSLPRDAVSSDFSLPFSPSFIDQKAESLTNLAREISNLLVGLFQSPVSQNGCLNSGAYQGFLDLHLKTSEQNSLRLEALCLTENGPGDIALSWKILSPSKEADEVTQVVIPALMDAWISSRLFLRNQGQIRMQVRDETIHFSFAGVRFEFKTSQGWTRLQVKSLDATDGGAYRIRMGASRLKVPVNLVGKIEDFKPMAEYFTVFGLRFKSSLFTQPGRSGKPSAAKDPVSGAIGKE